MIKDKYLYNSVDVATFVVAYANENRFGINMTKLQKLLYIMYGTFLSVKSFRLMDEHPQAWPYGPVFPTTRNRMLKRDMTSISMVNVPENMRTNQELNSLAKTVFKHFGTWTGSSLSQWSHKPGSPWDRTVNMKGFDWGWQIPDEYIQEYFNSIITRNG